ncbi:hypothetical protein [Streptomyces sp900116325]|uniref:hypothetical protein n=1 Tax=Streptomyces sp. 900116325 TaxID=3154295 RepID=UPI0033FC5E17
MGVRSRLGATHGCAEPLGGRRRRLLDGHRSVTGVVEPTRFGPDRGKTTVKGSRMADVRCPAGR